MLAEVETVCDDVVILNSGTVVAKGTTADVIGRGRQDMGQRTSVRVQVAAASMAHAQRLIEALPNVLRVTHNGEDGWLSISMVALVDGEGEDPRLTNRILEALSRADIQILSFGSGGSRLQDVFLDLTEDGEPTRAHG
jgi:ABC-type multidrug transport system ATPase subunit